MSHTLEAIILFGCTFWGVRFICMTIKNKPKERARLTPAEKKQVATKRIDSLDKVRATFKMNEYFTLHERSQREYPISIGETVTIWHKTSTKQFNVYHKDSVAGRGYLGHFKSWTLAKLYPGTEYKLKARISKIHEKTDKWDDVTVYFEKKLIVKKL